MKLYEKIIVTVMVLLTLSAISFAGTKVYYNLGVDVDGGTVYNLGNDSRNLITKGDVAVTVCAAGCNYTTIQAAVNDVPLFLTNEYKISISQGNYNENVSIPQIRTQVNDDQEPTREYMFIIEGDSASNVERVNISSLAYTGFSGKALIRHLSIDGSASYNEAVGIGAFWSSELNIFNVKFQPSVYYGIVSYGDSFIQLMNITFKNISGTCLYTKHGGTINSEPLSISHIQGNCQLDSIVANGGLISIAHNLTSQQDVYAPDRNMIYNYQTNTLYGVNVLPDDITNYGDINIQKNSPSLTLTNNATGGETYKWLSGTSGLFVYNSSSVVVQKIQTNGDVEIYGEMQIDGIQSDGNGKVVCIKTDGNLGTCTSTVGAGGTCTCT